MSGSQGPQRPSLTAWAGADAWRAWAHGDMRIAARFAAAASSGMGAQIEKASHWGSSQQLPPAAADVGGPHACVHHLHLPSNMQACAASMTNMKQRLQDLLHAAAMPAHPVCLPRTACLHARSPSAAGSHQVIAMCHDTHRDHRRPRLSPRLFCAQAQSRSLKRSSSRRRHRAGAASRRAYTWRWVAELGKARDAINTTEPACTDR
jgi:hypothetical protein